MTPKFKKLIHQLIKEELVKETSTKKKITEGVWSKGTPDQITEFIDHIKKMKDDYYDIVGSDDVFDGLDAAERAANELLDMNEATIETTPEKLDKVKEKADKDDIIRVNENQIEENNPKQLMSFLKDLNALIDNYHANIYTIDGVFQGLETIENAVTLHIDPKDLTTEAKEDDPYGEGYLNPKLINYKGKLSLMVGDLMDINTKIEAVGPLDEDIADAIEILDNKVDQLNKSVSNQITTESKKDEDEDDVKDKEPSKSDLKKKDSVATVSNKLQKIVAKMKEKAKAYKDAEGDEKEKIKDELKK